MKNPIPYTYDLNTKSAQKVICVTHTDDNSVDVIQLHVVQGGALIDFSGNTIIARMVMSRTHELLSDNVVCEIDEATKDVMIPIDRKAVSTRKGLMLIEVNVRGVLPEKLTLQFPLLVRVNGSILDDAEITPESQGTIPELLIAAAEELRRVQGFITSDDVYDILDSTLQGAQNVTPSLYVKRKGDNYALVYKDSDDVLHELFDFSNLPSGTSDYTDLESKPQINNVTLLGNKSSDDLGLQKKLTAGTNITIANDGTISASGGVTNYNNLTGKPTVQVNGSQIVPLSGKLTFTSGFYLANYLPGELIRIDLSNVSRSALENWQNYLSGTQIPSDNYFTAQYDFNNLRNPQATGEMDFADAGFFKCIGKCLVNTPQAFSSSIGDNSRVMIIHFNTIPRNEQFHYLLRVIYFQDSITNKIRQFTQWIYFESEQDTTVHNVTDWCEIGNSQIVSGVVNQNGTITFTDSDGSTFTTTGSSVIGADGFSPVATVTQTASGATVSITDSTGTTTANISNGADGQDYVLTAQDKSDIADIVLSELPTTQGVLYGNTSN